MAARRVALAGALGRMGECVRTALAEEPGLALAAALEAPGHPGLGRDLGGGVSVGDDPKAALATAELAIVFSPPAPALVLLRLAAERGVRCVVGTTGFDAEQRAEIGRLAQRVAIVLAPNFSVAVNVLGHLVERAARLLDADFDVEIVELHHAAKRDAPSGTALWLAEAAARGRGDSGRRVLAREGDVGPRPAGAIGVQALRGGDNPGEHSVLFLGRGERLELTHRAATRDHFARGALRAALWVAAREPGLYAMGDVLGLESRSSSSPSA
jgi:4-hydroxy-tetrahydrodipicolinate reductase